jgi:hypothetical protein
MLERKPEERVSVAAIIDELRRPPFGVRDGLSPLLLTTVLVQHESEIAIYEDGRFVPEVEEFLLMRLVKRPETFAFQLTRITGVRRRLIERFADILTSKAPNKAELVSIVRPLCAAVAGLPEYAQTTDRISEKARAIRTAVLGSEDPSQLIFYSIPRALGFDGNDAALDATKVAKMLSEALIELRRAFPELQGRMATAVLRAFGSDDTLTVWRPKMSARAETALLAVTDPDLKTFSLKLRDAQSAEHDWLESLGSFLVRRPPSRWRDQDEGAFVQHVTELAQRYFRLEATHFGHNATHAQEAIRVALTRATGDEVERVLSLSAKQIAEAGKHEAALEAELPKDPTLALAILSQLMWKIMRTKP